MARELYARRAGVPRRRRRLLRGRCGRSWAATCASCSIPEPAADGGVRARLARHARTRSRRCSSSSTRWRASGSLGRRAAVRCSGTASASTRPPAWRASSRSTTRWRWSAARGRLMQAAAAGRDARRGATGGRGLRDAAAHARGRGGQRRRADGGLGAHPRHRAFRDRARPAGRRVLPPVAHLACVSLAHDGPGGGGLRVGGARRERARARDPVRFLHDRRMDRRR